MEPWQQPAGEECPSTEFPADGRTVAAALGCVIGNFACTIFGKGKCTVFRKVKCTS